MLRGERHLGWVGAGQGATLEHLDDQPAAVEHAGLDVPRHERAEQGSAVAVVADLELGLDGDAVGFVAVPQGGPDEPAGVELGGLGRRQQPGDGPLDAGQPGTQSEVRKSTPRISGLV